MQLSADLSPISCRYTDCIYTNGEDLPPTSSGYNTKPSDGEALVLELWGMWSTPLLLFLSGPFETICVQIELLVINSYA